MKKEGSWGEERNGRETVWVREIVSNEDNEAVYRIMAEWLGDDKILRFTTIK